MLRETILQNDTMLESLWFFFIWKLQNFLDAPRMYVYLCKREMRYERLKITQTEEVHLHRISFNMPIRGFTCKIVEVSTGLQVSLVTRHNFMRENGAFCWQTPPPPVDMPTPPPPPKWGRRAAAADPHMVGAQVCFYATATRPFI